MPVYTTNFAALLDPGLRKIYGDDYRQYAEEYSKVFDIDTSKKAVEYDRGITDLGLVPEKPEGSPVKYDEAYQGYQKSYTHVTYGKGIAVTREMYEDDLYRKIKSLPKSLARSVRHSIEIIGANHLNRAFNSSYTGSDSLELCSTAHTMVGGGTYRNELASAADLDITSYEQALIDIQMELKDDRNKLIAARPQKMIIHPANEFNAKQILKSAQLPGTANNDINPANGTMPGGLCVMHWMTDTDAWFIKTDVPNGLTWFWRRKPVFTNDNDHDTDNAKFKVTYRCSSGWTDPRGLFGSPGV